MATRGPHLALAAMVALYVAVFGWLTWLQQSNYGTFGYDMGLHDQGIWLLSRGGSSLVTIRGMPYLGHHVNLVSYLYVPAYRLGAGPHFLYATQTVALALGAVPVWLLGRDRLSSVRRPSARRRSQSTAGGPGPASGGPQTDGAGPPATHGPAAWLALVPAGAYLLHPSLEWINWWHWHPEALAVTPLLFAWWFAVRRRWWPFGAAVALALSTKEDVALAVLMLGLVMAVTARRRLAGLATAAAGLGWFAVCTRLVIPRELGGIPFYERQLFPAFGTSLGSVVVGMATDPREVWAMATEASRVTYYARMVAPLGPAPIFGLPLLLIAGPQLGVNVLSALPGTHDIRFQYSAVVVAALFVATVEGLGFLHRRRRVAGRVAVALLAGCALVGHVAWSPSPLGRDYDTGIWARSNPRGDVFDRAVALVPAGAGVSASYYLIPHLTHRRDAFEWPNPFVLVNWGVAGENPPASDRATYLVIDRTLGQEARLLESLTASGSGDYEVVFEEEAVVVARRRAR